MMRSPRTPIPVDDYDDGYRAPRPAPRSAPVSESSIAAARSVMASRSHKRSAIVRGDTISRAIPAWQRVGSIALLVLSFVGTIVAFHGGWAPVLSLHIRPLALLGGVGLQVWCLVFQIMNRHKKLGFWYIQALILDVVPTYVGFLPVFAGLILTILGLFGPLTERLDLIRVGGYTGLQITVSLLSLVFAFAMAFIPEDRLID